MVVAVVSVNAIASGNGSEYSHDEKLMSEGIKKSILTCNTRYHEEEGGVRMSSRNVQV